MSEKNKLCQLDELKEIVAREKRAGKRIVSTSGCFDLLHAGHVRYLSEAKEAGDVLIVMLNSDVSVRALKGTERPIVPQEERAAVIAGLGCVDYVICFDALTPCGLIRALQPDVVVKGGDYAGVHIPEMDETKKYGGRVAYVSMTPGCSSTSIIEKIRNQKERDSNSKSIETAAKGKR